MGRFGRGGQSDGSGEPQETGNRYENSKAHPHTSLNDSSILERRGYYYTLKLLGIARLQPSSKPRLACPSLPKLRLLCDSALRRQLIFLRKKIAKPLPTFRY
jgi:hypothetical protein